MLRAAGWWLLRVLVPVLCLAVFAALVRMPMGAESDTGLLRLAWRTIGSRIRVCRDYTADEVRRFPAHMRAGQFCAQSLLPYRVRASVDGRTVFERLVEPAGLRGDRPLFVHHDIPLTPGPHTLQLSYDPAPPRQVADPALLAATRTAAEQGVHYALARTISIAAGRIVQIDVNEFTHRFEVVGEPGDTQRAD